MTRLAMLAPVLALLGAGAAHAAGEPQQTAGIVAGKPPGAAASDMLVGHGLQQLGQHALIHVPDPARPCRFDIQMEQQDGRPTAWESVNLCHAPEPGPTHPIGAKAGQ